MKLLQTMSLQKKGRYACLIGAGVGLLLVLIALIASLWGMFAIGIIVLLGGFFGAWAIWSFEKENAQIYKIHIVVTKEGKSSMQDIAKAISVQTYEVRTLVDKCMKKGLLDGYKRVGDSVVSEAKAEEVVQGEDEQEKPVIKTYSKQCPHCGANYIASDETDICPYCSSGV